MSCSSCLFVRCSGHATEKLSRDSRYRAQCLSAGRFWRTKWKQAVNRLTLDKGVVRSIRTRIAHAQRRGASPARLHTQLQAAKADVEASKRAVTRFQESFTHCMVAVLEGQQKRGK